jgi:hypothetical protein
MKKSAFLIIPLVLISLFLFIGCDGLGGGSSVRNEDSYFKGYDGVSMKVMPGTPSTAYYYSQNPTVGDNVVNFNIQVQNTGSADTYGGVYISGYDPNFIEVDGVMVQKTGSGGDCDLQGFIGQNNNWLATAFCRIWDSDLFVDIKGGDTWRELGIEVVNGKIGGDTWKKIFEKTGAPDTLVRWMQGLELEFDYDPQTGKGSIGVDYAGSQYDFGAGYNGRAAIAFFSTIYHSIPEIGRFINPAHGKDFTLLGDRPNYPGGEMDIKPFNAKIKTWPQGLTQTDQTFMFTSCYVYTTYADPQVCIDPYPESSERKVCKPKKISYPSGQGAPVAITSIEQTNTPRAIIFTITIQNKGKGLIYHPMSLHKCDPLNANRVTQADLNFVFVGDIRLANEYKQFRCQPESRMIRLDEKGVGIFTCEAPIEYNVKTAYQSPLVVSLWYGYSETITKKIMLKRGN